MCHSENFDNNTPPFKGEYYHKKGKQMTFDEVFDIVCDEFDMNENTRNQFRASLNVEDTKFKYARQALTAALKASGTHIEKFCILETCGYLTAFSSKEDAVKFKKEYGAVSTLILRLPYGKFEF